MHTERNVPLERPPGRLVMKGVNFDLKYETGNETVNPNVVLNHHIVVVTRNKRSLMCRNDAEIFAGAGG